MSENKDLRIVSREEITLEAARDNLDEIMAFVEDQLEATESFDGLLGHMSINPENHNPSRDAAIFRVDADTVTYVGIYEP